MAAKSAGFTLDTKQMRERLALLARQSPLAIEKAERIAAMQFLTWANTGTGKSSRKPPIRYGVLRGSSSAFVQGKFVGVYAGPRVKVKDIATSGADPNVSMLFVWNAPYATKMHEWQGGWGPYTLADGDAGNNWVTDHIAADGPLLMDIIAREMRKALGT